MKKIAILGSAKHHTFATDLSKELEHAGFYVFLFPDAHELRQTNLDSTALELIDKGLTFDAFEKIKRSDYALFINMNGYMGNSATLELGYSAALSKHIITLNHDSELTREALFNDVLETEDIEQIASIMKQKFL